MNFDLNIHNYNVSELEQIFELSPDYNISILDLQEKKLIDSILKNNDNNMNPEIKKKTIDFLRQAKLIIVDDKKKKDTGIVPEYLNALWNLNYGLKSSKLIEEGGSNIVQERNRIPYNTSNPREFFQGVINPLTRTSTRKFLNIDTRFRDNYYTTQSTNFNLTLPLKLDNVLTLQLTAIEFPTSFYNVSKQNNNNFFSITIDETGESKLIEIPSGNYSLEVLITYINSKLQSFGGYFSKIVFTFNVTSTSSGSGQVVVGILSGNDFFNFSLDFQTDNNGNRDYYTPLTLKFGWILGFRAGEYVNNYTYVSEGIPNLTGSRYVFLVIDDYNNNVSNNFYSAFNSSILNKNILARISVFASGFQEMSQNNLLTITTPRQYFGPVDIEKMNIQLLDEYGRVVDLNNMDYSFNLTFQTAYNI